MKSSGKSLPPAPDAPPYENINDNPINYVMDKIGITIFDIALRKRHPLVKYIKRKRDDFDKKRLEFALKEEKEKVKYLSFLLEAERANKDSETK